MYCSNDVPVQMSPATGHVSADPLGDALHEREVALGVYLGHVRAAVAEPDLCRLQTELSPHRGPEAVSELVRVPVGDLARRAGSGHCLGVGAGGIPLTRLALRSALPAAT